MPTKHKRKRGNDDKTQYDLPPTSHARSLPVIAPTRDFLTARPRSQTQPPKRQKLRNVKPADDTPKNFARLMAWHTQGKKLAPGLDDGVNNSKAAQKKRRKQNTALLETQGPTQAQAQEPNTTTNSAASDAQAQIQTQPESTKVQPLKILPGETLSEFNFRVDQALPLSGAKSQSAKSSTSLPADLRIKARLTKHNKRLARMQADWRATEERLRAKEEELDEDGEERREEEKLLWEDVKLVGGKKKRKIVDEDPWKELEKKRGAETRQKNVRDVVLEPPTLKVGGVKNIFKERTFKPNDEGKENRRRGFRGGEDGGRRSRGRRGVLRP